MVILLVIMGAFFSLVFVVSSLLRAARGREKVSFFETLLAFLALVFPVLALVNNSGSTQPLPLVNMAAIGIGIVVAVVSILTFIIERRKAGRPLAHRRGVLGVGLGLLMVAATFVVPVAAKLQPPARVSTNTSASASSSGSNLNVANVGSSPTPAPTQANIVAVEPTQTVDTALLQMSATPTRFPSPMPTPTNTPFIIATTTNETVSHANQPTDQVAAAQVSDCLAVARQNVNLRGGPGTTYQLLLTIPFSTTLNVSAKDKAADWWFVTYQNQTGWVSAEYVNVNGTCDALPTKSE